MEETRTILLRSEVQRGTLIDLVNGVALDEASPLVVTLKPFEKLRTDRQNRLMWAKYEHLAKWMLVPDDDGVFNHKSKEYWHHNMKIIHLGIKCWETCLFTGVKYPVPNSTKTGIKPFNEYMMKLDEWARDRGVILPSPEDLHDDDRYA